MSCNNKHLAILTCFIGSHIYFMRSFYNSDTVRLVIDNSILVE